MRREAVLRALRDAAAQGAGSSSASCNCWPTALPVLQHGRSHARRITVKRSTETVAGRASGHEASSCAAHPPDPHMKSSERLGACGRWCLPEANSHTGERSAHALCEVRGPPPSGRNLLRDVRYSGDRRRCQRRAGGWYRFWRCYWRSGVWRGPHGGRVAEHASERQSLASTTHTRPHAPRSLTEGPLPHRGIRTVSQ